MEPAHWPDCQEREQHARLSTEKRQSKQRGYKDSCLPFTCKTRCGVLLYTVWSPHIQEATQKLDMVQPKAARYVINRYRNTSSVTSMLDHLQWEPLDSRRIKHRLAMMFKILHGLINIPTDKYLTPASTRMRSHHGQKFKQIQASTDYYKHSFFRNCPSLEFPVDICCWCSLLAGILQKGAFNPHLLISVRTGQM